MPYSRLFRFSFSFVLNIKNCFHNSALSQAWERWAKGAKHLSPNGRALRPTSRLKKSNDFVKRAPII
jgi:hypothetical protein